jgi:hypothetical protein
MTEVHLLDLKRSDSPLLEKGFRTERESVQYPFFGYMKKIPFSVATLTPADRGKFILHLRE